MKVEYGIDKFMYHPIYVIFVVLVIVPLDLYFMFTGQILIGLILLLMQTPWAVFGFAGKFEHTAELMGMDQ